MNRRQVLEQVMWMMGGAISAPLITGFLSGCDSPNVKSQKSSIFKISSTNERVITEIAERIIPTTDTPGAKAAKVPEFILMMFDEYYAETDKKRFVDCLEKLKSQALKTYKQPFLTCSEQEQTALLVTFETIAKKLSYEDRKAATPFIHMIKELTLLGYFTSKIGATQVLNYKPIPCAYHGCVRLEPNQKAWS